MKTGINNTGQGLVTGDQLQNDTTGIVTAYVLKVIMGPKEQDLDNVIAVDHMKFEGLRSRIQGSCFRA